MGNVSPDELIEMFFHAQSGIDTQFQYWVSVTFAVVVASFVAGDRLSRGMRYLVAVLYSLATAALTSRAAEFVFMSIEAIDRLQESGVADLLPQPGWRLGVFRILLYAIGTVSALWFLLQRRQAATQKA